MHREFVIDNLLVRIHFITVMIQRTGLVPWELDFPFPGSLLSTFLGGGCSCLMRDVPGHTVDYDPFIKSQLASRKSLQGLTP